MAHMSMLEEPMVVHTKPAIEMDEEQFYQFCRINDDLQIERNADGDILIITPEGGSSGVGSSKLNTVFGIWSDKDGNGELFGSSTGFILPNKAMRSPDIAWVRNERLDALTPKQWERFLPLCPDFVLELRSPSDSVRHLRRKMEEYLQNGAQLGWLLNPADKSVEIYQPGQKVQVLENPPALSGEPVLKGFVLEVQKIWAAMERRRSRPT